MPQHQEKNGAFFWNRWVNVLLKFLNFSEVPMWPLDLKLQHTISTWHKTWWLWSELTSPQTHSASEQAGEDSSRPSAPERGWGFAPGELTSASRTWSGRSLCQSEKWVGGYGIKFCAAVLLTRNKSCRSSQRSWTKFMSLTLGSSKSLVSWENGT